MIWTGTERNNFDLRLGVRITDVDPERKTVTGDDGSVTPFDKLLLATGSPPLIPALMGSKRTASSSSATWTTRAPCWSARGRESKRW